MIDCITINFSISISVNLIPSIITSLEIIYNFIMTLSKNNYKILTKDYEKLLICDIN